MLITPTKQDTEHDYYYLLDNTSEHQMCDLRLRGLRVQKYDKTDKLLHPFYHTELKDKELRHLRLRRLSMIKISAFSIHH